MTYFSNVFVIKKTDDVSMVFPMIFTIFADVRVRSGACLAAKGRRNSGTHAGVFRAESGYFMIYRFFFSRYVFDISWYVKLDRTNIWKIQKTWTLQSLRSFDPTLTCWDWGLWCVHCFYEGPMGPGILLCWSIDLFLFCFCFVFFNVLKHLKTLKMAILVVDH